MATKKKTVKKVKPLRSKETIQFPCGSSLEIVHMGSELLIMKTRAGAALTDGSYRLVILQHSLKTLKEVIRRVEAAFKLLNKK